MTDPYDLILGDRSTVTDEDVRYFAEDPRRLEMLDVRETGRYQTQVYLLILAIAFIVISKLLVARYDDAVEHLLNGVLVDLFFEIGSALIGALTVLLFLRRNEVHQFRENLELRRQIEARIAAMKPGEERQPGG